MHEVVSSSQGKEVVEPDDSSLSSGELDELDELLERQDSGEEIDEDRLYELDLFDK